MDKSIAGIVVATCLIIGFGVGLIVGIAASRESMRTEVLQTRNMLDDWWEARHAAKGPVEFKVEARP